MTKGDILGNSLTGAHFSCNSHGNIPFPAGKECPSLRPPPRAELTPAISQRCSQPSPRDWGLPRCYYKPCAQVHVERRSLPQPLVLFQATANGAFLSSKTPSRTWSVPSQSLLPQVGYFPFPSQCFEVGARLGCMGQWWEGTGGGTLLLQSVTASPSPPWESLAGNCFGRKAGSGGNTQGKGVQQHVLKESHCGQWPQFGGSWYYWRRKGEKEANPLPKRYFFFLIIWSAKSSDALQMGQDLISPAYTQVSARSCFSKF